MKSDESEHLKTEITKSEIGLQVQTGRLVQFKIVQFWNLRFPIHPISHFFFPFDPCLLCLEVLAQGVEPRSPRLKVGHIAALSRQSVVIEPYRSAFA